MAAPMNQENQPKKTFPISTNQKSVEVDSNPTDVLCSRFGDRLFIVVSQYKKLGNLVSITRDNVADDFQSASPAFSTKVLLGNDQPFTHVLAKNLISKITVDKPILLSFSLKDTSAKAVSTISNIIKDLR
ncbi:hypothetical protein ScPMuIL_001491 [Solemya velum]